MVCLGLEPGAAEWKAQTNPLSYGGTPLNNPLSVFRKDNRPHFHNFKFKTIGIDMSS